MIEEEKFKRVFCFKNKTKADKGLSTTESLLLLVQKKSRTILQSSNVRFLNCIFRSIMYFQDQSKMSLSSFETKHDD